MDERAAIDGNLLASARLLAAAVPGSLLTTVGTTTVVVTRVPPPGMNGVLGLRDPELHDVLAGIALVRAEGVEPMVRLDPDASDEVLAGLEGLGLVEAAPNPCMSCRLDQEPPSRLPIRVEAVGDPRALATFADTMATGFGVDVSAVRRAFQETLLDLPDQASFIGYVGDEPVGTSSVVMSGPPGTRTAGVYSVSVVPTFRRLGYGTALTVAALALGRRWGATLAVLEASPMGEPVYRAMGFIEVVRYRTFISP